MRIFTLLATLALSTTAFAQSTLTTTFAGGLNASGNMFDLVAIDPAGVTIRGFDVHLNAGFWNLRVYKRTVPGPYLPSVNTTADWTLVGQAGGVQSNGINVATPVPIVINEYVPNGATQSFYVTVTSGSGINYTVGSATGALFTSDASLEIYEGAGLTYPFTSNANPRVFNGNIHYYTGLLDFASKQTFGMGCGGNPVGDAQYEQFSTGTFDLSGTGHTYTWTGNGYELRDGAGAIVPPTNSPTPFNLDDVVVTTTGFLMPSPSGIGADIAICSNGWLTFDSSVTDADYTESVAELRNDPWSRIAFLWDDLNPEGGGTVHLEQVGLGEFHVTFTDVPEFVTGGANNCQVALFANGNIEVRYGACTLTDCLVGCSPGFGAGDLGGTDYSNLINTGRVAVETGVGPYSPPLSLDSNLPALGQNWDLTLDDGEAFAVFFFGEVAIDPGVDLTPLGGDGCEGYTNASLGGFFGPISAGTAIYSVAVPANPALVGAELTVQALSASASVPWGFSTSNGLTGTVGY